MTKPTCCWYAVFAYWLRKDPNHAFTAQELAMSSVCKKHQGPLTDEEAL